MKHFWVVLAVIASMFLVSCASQAKANKTTGGQAGTEKLTATGYTQEGCLLNLNLTAREKNMRLIPEDIQVETTTFMFLIPFINHEGYRCSGSVIERRPTSKDPLYPID